MSNFSDYIVFADESGSPVLDGADPDYPVFVLLLVLVKKDVYANSISPAISQLKFDFVGHDQIILHERDIRRQGGAFAFLQVDKGVRVAFMDRINDLVAAAEIEVIACIVHKQELKAKYSDPWSPYHLALHFALERLWTRLDALGQRGKHIHCVFESRGSNEDKELERVFGSITANNAQWGIRRHDFRAFDWTPLFLDKKSNSAGLQLADLMARPLGLRRLRPQQPNRAADIIAQKIPSGGWKCFP